MKVVVTGVSGILGRMVAARLAAERHKVIGIDVRPWPDAPPGVEVHVVDVRKRAAEDVIRTARPAVVVHMGTLTQFTAPTEERERINLDGTRKVFEHCHRYKVKHVVFVGRHTFYGASGDSPLYHTEDEPPVAVTKFPELTDLVAADLFAGSSLWRYPDMTTTVLRMCYTLGPAKHGTLATFLKGPMVPMVLGFDPLFQFMHEQDVTSAIVLAAKSKVAGVFNVAGPQPVPLSLVVRVTGRTAVPLPEPIFRRLLGRFGLPKLTPGAMQHIKHAVVIDASRFRAATGFQHQIDEVQAMEAFRWA
ncbi:MAG: SDR family oxidoreductase [Deltaproteobacteria bacterium]|nr:SDR family oxidoreductase [Deltaproteobacteria bacterium]